MNESTQTASVTRPPPHLSAIESLVEFAKRSLIYENTTGVPSYAAAPLECDLSINEVMDYTLSRLNLWRTAVESTCRKRECKEKDEELDYLKSRVCTTSTC